MLKNVFLKKYYIYLFLSIVEVFTSICVDPVVIVLISVDLEWGLDELISIVLGESITVVFAVEVLVGLVALGSFVVMVF